MSAEDKGPPLRLERAAEVLMTVEIQTRLRHLHAERRSLETAKRLGRLSSEGCTRLPAVRFEIDMLSLELADRRRLASCR